MNLRIDDKIKLIPISLDYVAEIHESFTDEIIEFLPIEKLSKKTEQQEKGIVKKVVFYVLNWGISNLDVEFIKYPVDVRNTRSIKLIEKLDLKLSDHYKVGDQKILEVDEYRIYKKTTANNR